MIKVTEHPSFGILQWNLLVESYTMQLLDQIEATMIEIKFLTAVCILAYSLYAIINHHYDSVLFSTC